MSDDKLPDVWVEPDGYGGPQPATWASVRYIPFSRHEAEVARLTAENKKK